MLCPPPLALRGGSFCGEHLDAERQSGELADGNASVSMAAKPLKGFQELFDVYLGNALLEGFS